MIPTDLQLNALNGLYGLSAHSLVRVTLDHDGSTVSVQIVMLESASEDEVENLRCFVTEVIAHFFDDELNEEYIFVADASEARAIADLPIKLYAVWGANHFGGGSQAVPAAAARPDRAKLAPGGACN